MSYPVKLKVKETLRKATSKMIVVHKAYVSCIKSICRLSYSLYDQEVASEGESLNQESLVVFESATFVSIFILCGI